MQTVKFSKSVLLMLFLGAMFSAAAQTNRSSGGKKNVRKTSATQNKTAETEPVEAKKNARPETAPPDESVRTNARPADNAQETKPVYFYGFDQPKFTVSKINIEHDENGKGKITFLKKDFSEAVSDPLQLSPTALERVKAVWQALNFLDSTVDYQYEKDYSHLGNMTFTVKKDGASRTTKFNWTENKDAKNLADEYRRIGQQFIWIFDINVARENQPLDAPRLMDALDSMIRRNEVSDAEQLVPFLKELNDDERIPLIARHHADKLVKQIEMKK